MNLIRWSCVALLVMAALALTPTCEAQRYRYNYRPRYNYQSYSYRHYEMPRYHFVQRTVWTPEGPKIVSSYERDYSSPVSYHSESRPSETKETAIKKEQAISGERLEYRSMPSWSEERARLLETEVTRLNVVSVIPDDRATFERMYPKEVY